MPCKACKRGVDRSHELLGQTVDIDWAAPATVWISIAESTSDLVPQPDVIDDQAVELLLAGERIAPSPVGTADGLKQRVESERLVEVHDTFDLGVEPGQQLGGDDQEPERIGRITEAGFDRCFLLTCQPESFLPCWQVRPWS